MSRLLFNSIIIIVCLLAIVAIAIIVPSEYRKSVNKFHILIQIIAIVIAVALFIFMLLSLDYSGTPCATGDIIEIRTLSSFAGIYDRYKIILVDANGNTHEIQSIFSFYGHSSEMMSQMQIGDYCEVYGSTVIDGFFYSIHSTK